MRRSPQLQPFSREHHTTLALALRAEKAAAAGPDELRAVAAQVVEGYNSHIKQHFEEEERWLLPSLNAAGEQALVERTFREHAELHASVARLATVPDAAGLRDFARLLRDHVRFEERELFPAFENMDGDPKSWFI